METALAESPWLAGKEFSLPDIGYAPYAVRIDRLQLQFLWDKRPHFAGWYERLLERRAHKEALEDWFKIDQFRTTSSSFRYSLPENIFYN
jgi:glutathione S-transferase